MAGEIGLLVREGKKHLRDSTGYVGFQEAAEHRLGSTLWYAATLASRLGLSLDAVAAANLEYVAARWGSPLPLPPASPYDTEFQESERLPRQLTITFLSSLADRGEVAQMFKGAGVVGDPLRDLAVMDDGYRFHDAFHLVFVTLLGWSPTMRKLLACRRASVQQVRDVEDGGRAIVIEEGLVAYIFAAAAEHSFFAEAKHVPTELLVTCRRLVAGLEVSSRTAFEWEQAILEGFRVWRALTALNGGVVVADADLRTLLVQPPA